MFSTVVPYACEIPHNVSPCRTVWNDELFVTGGVIVEFCFVELSRTEVVVDFELFVEFVFVDGGGVVVFEVLFKFDEAFVWLF